MHVSVIMKVMVSRLSSVTVFYGWWARLQCLCTRGDTLVVWTGSFM